MISLRFDYPLVGFILIATLKGVVEFWVSRHCHWGGNESSKGISVVFIVLGVTMPLLVFVEILLAHSFAPLPVCLAFAATEVALLALRVHCVHTLGVHYSVHVRIIEGHRLVQSGLYRYVRHPLYLIALLEAVAYPLAAGAWRSMIILVLLQAPAILWRRRQEEARLLATFGAEFEAYRERTLW